MPISKMTISNTADVYECFPDVALTPTGRLVVVYRESDSHGADAFSHLVFRTSDDLGRTWSPRRYLVRSDKSAGVLAKWNCPRISFLRDGRLALVCDYYPQPPGETYGPQPPLSHLWFSSDDAETWDGPIATPVDGIVPDRLVELSDGAWLLAAHRGFAPTWRLLQRVWRSDDRGATWTGPFTVADADGLNLCEASILELPDGALVAYMRENSGQGWPIFKSLSADGGRTWSGPYPTLMDAGHRPTAGLLPSGNVLVTYRYIPGWSVRNLNTFACREPAASAAEPDRARQTASILPLDHDRSPASDTGYTGWVVLPDGETIFVVNYILDDSPTAQIRGYYLTERDF
jgi:sialidase-1